MVMIIPKQPGFAERLGTGVGQGFGQGFSGAVNQAADFGNQMRMAQAKQMSQAPAEQMNKQNSLNAIGRMREYIKSGKLGWNILGKFTPEGRAQRAGFDTAALNLEKLAADMVGKGTLSKERFNFLKERLPSSDKTDAENEQILKEWESIIGESFLETEPEFARKEIESPMKKERPSLSSFYR